jgi:hypothetical protein
VFFFRRRWLWGLGQATVWGLAAVQEDHTKARPGPNTFYVDSVLVARPRKIRLARVGNTAVSRGTKDTVLDYDPFLGRQGQTLVYERARTGLVFLQLTLATIT